MKRNIVLLLLLLFPLRVEALVPNDPQYSNQWYLDSIGAPTAWDKTTGSDKVIVAVLDTGAEFAHPDLTDNIWVNPGEVTFNSIDDDKNGYIDDIYGWDFINNKPNPGPDFSQPQTVAGFQHGTVTASLIGAVGNNGTDGVGVVWKVKIMPLKVLNEEGTGDPGPVIRAIDYAIAKGAGIINLSFTGLKSPDENLYRAIQRAHEAKIVVVAAAGNDADHFTGGDLDFNPQYPACYDGPNGEPWWVIGVAALGKDNRKAVFSDYGFKCVDISAPGVEMPAAMVYHQNYPEHSQSFGGKWSGTSLAAPLVTGAVALIKSTRPNLGPKEIYDVLTQSADNIDLINPLFLRQLGAGKLNLAKAVDLTEKLYPARNIQKQILFSPPVSGSEIKLFNSSGKEELKFSLKGRFALAANIALGDVNGDGEDEIIAAPAVSAPPEVKVLNQKGELINSFFAYGAKFRGTVNLAAADLDNDGRAEIITAVGSGGGPQIRIFNADGQLLNPGFFAEASNYRNGINIAAADVDSDGEVEILVAVQGKGVLKIFTPDGLLKQSYLVYNKYKGKWSIGAADIDGDGQIELVTAKSERNPIAQILTPNGKKKGETKVKGDYRQGLKILIK